MVKSINYDAPYYVKFPHVHLTYSPLGPHILFSTLFANTLKQHSSHMDRGQVSHPYEAGKIIVWYDVCFKLYFF